MPVGDALLAVARSTGRCLTAAGCFLAMLTLSGCSSTTNEIGLPADSVLQRDQLVVHSDFRIPRKHRLIDELTARRGDISEQLVLPVSDEPINIFIFDDEDGFQKYMSKNHPDFPDRRAFFVMNDTELKVFAFWDDRVGEDLRHEVTHGYLHSVIPNLPLWLDEGLAEYYETPRGSHGLNQTHVYHLNEAFRRDEWEPSLEKLEMLEDPALMTQLQYAESWLWVHFLLESDEGNPQILQDQLARLRMAAESEPLSKFVQRDIADCEIKLVEHLKKLSEGL